jgi:hypothetical protein
MEGTRHSQEGDIVPHSMWLRLRIKQQGISAADERR